MNHVLCLCITACFHSTWMPAEFARAWAWAKACSCSGFCSLRCAWGGTLCLARTRTWGWLVAPGAAGRGPALCVWPAARYMRAAATEGGGADGVLCPSHFAKGQAAVGQSNLAQQLSFKPICYASIMRTAPEANTAVAATVRLMSSSSWAVAGTALRLSAISSPQ